MGAHLGVHSSASAHALLLDFINTPFADPTQPDAATSSYAGLYRDYARPCTTTQGPWSWREADAGSSRVQTDGVGRLRQKGKEGLGKLLRRNNVVWKLLGVIFLGRDVRAGSRLGIGNPGDDGKWTVRGR